MKKKPNEIESAKLLLDSEKKLREKKAKEAFEKLCKEHNVQFIPIVQLGNANIPVHELLKCGVGFTVVSL